MRDRIRHDFIDEQAERLHGVIVRDGSEIECEGHVINPQQVDLARNLGAHRLRRAGDDRALIDGGVEIAHGVAGDGRSLHLVFDPKFHQAGKPVFIGRARDVYLSLIHI